MALFKKKNQTEETKTEAVEATSAASENEGAKVVAEYKELVLKALDKKMEKGNLYDGCIIMPRGFTIDVRIGRYENKEEIKLLQVVFIVSHDDFDEPIIDPVDSQGKTFEDAAKMAVDIFYGALWHPIDQALFKKTPIHVPVTYLNQHYDFDMYAQSIVRMGAEDTSKPTMIVGFIMNELPKYIGSKKYYWVRIYLAKHKDRQIIEVRINGSVCFELSKYYEEYVKSWNAEETFKCEKQYAIFVQREEDKCPFKKDLVMTGAKFVLDKLPAISTHEEYLAMADELDDLIENKDVAAEVRIFVPEVMAKMTLGYQEGDSLFLLDGDNRIEFKKTQLRSYFYVQQAVLEFLNQRPPQEVVQNIVGKSVAFRELRNIIQSSNEKAKAEGKEGGLKPNDLYVPGTAYKVANENYKAW